MALPDFLSDADTAVIPKTGVNPLSWLMAQAEQEPAQRPAWGLQNQDQFLRALEAGKIPPGFKTPEEFFNALEAGRVPLEMLEGQPRPAGAPPIGVTGKPPMPFKETAGKPGFSDMFGPFAPGLSNQVVPAMQPNFNITEEEQPSVLPVDLSPEAVPDPETDPGLGPSAPPAVRRAPAGRGPSGPGPAGLAGPRLPPPGQEEPWSMWVTDPQNRAFMLAMGLQLLQGGWGDWGQQLSRAIQAGVQSSALTEAEQIRQGNILTDQALQAERIRTAGRGRGRAGKTIEPDVSISDILSMLKSDDPVVRAQGQAAAAKKFKAPRSGYVWGVNEKGFLQQIPVAPKQGTGKPGGSQGRFTAAAQAGVDSATVTIHRFRDAVDAAKTRDSVPKMVERGASLLTGIGNTARLARSMGNAVAGYMHARSGAQTHIKEYEEYVKTFMPVAGDSDETIYYKLADLEFQVLLIARRTGENVDTRRLFDLNNEMREKSGLPPVSEAEFAQLLPKLENQAVSNLPGGGAGLTQQAPTQQTVSPPASQAPARQDFYSNPSTRAPGAWQTAPNGRKYRIIQP